MTQRKKFADDFEEETGYRFRPLRWFFAVVGIGVAVYLVLGFVGIATLPFRTASGVAHRVGDPDNVIFQYEHFHDMCGDVVSFDQQYRGLVKQAKARAKEIKGQPDPIGQKAESVQRIEDDAQGVLNQRISVTNQYNADSRKVTERPFKAHGLPHRLQPYPHTPRCEGGN